MSRSRYALVENGPVSLTAEARFQARRFIADGAFCRAFGAAGRLDESAVLHQMLRRAAQHRANPWHLQVCVRRDGELIGLLDGNANLTERSVRMLHAMSGEQESGEGGSMRRRPPRWITGLARQATGWRLGARVDEAFERRIARWAQLAPPSRYAGMHRFHISTVAVDPDERGRGHLHAMLGRVSAYCARYPAIERATVGTYAAEQAEHYQRAGFTLDERVEDAQDDRLCLWWLGMPPRSVRDAEELAGSS